MSSVLGHDAIIQLHPADLYTQLFRNDDSILATDRSRRRLGYGVGGVGLATPIEDTQSGIIDGRVVGGATVRIAEHVPSATFGTSASSEKGISYLAPPLALLKYEQMS